jgi:hypothetical protein
MRALLILVSFLISTFSTLSLAAEPSDPRNAEGYRVLFDIEAQGDTDLVRGYGGYLQIYGGADQQWIRYCTNFDGKGLSGRPNPQRERMKLLPFGTIDPTAYRCRDLTIEDVAKGYKLVELGSRSFYEMKTTRWTPEEGGVFIFQFAKKIPLFGSPTYKTFLIRASREGSGLNYVVESVIPRTGIIPSHRFLYNISGSGLGIPNGINGLVINPGERSSHTVNIDDLNGSIDSQQF